MLLIRAENLTTMMYRDYKRDLVTGITIRRGTSTNVVLRNYTYDALGRPLTRSTSRNGSTQNDTFGYNPRSELVSATLGNASITCNEWSECFFILSEGTGTFFCLL